MASGILDIDLDAITANWRALDAMSPAHVQTAVMVKADGYGLGAAPIARALMAAGARRFFVALTEEGVALRLALGPEAEINILSGHMEGDTARIGAFDLVPMLNSRAQVERHFSELPNHPFGIQLETGMNRLGIDAADWRLMAPSVLAHGPRLLMSHMACADEPGHPLNDRQLETFRQMTDGTGVARSFSATGGILLGRQYDFDLTRPGIGLYGGAPFTDARPVVKLSLPVVQVRTLSPGDTVGYNATWQATAPARIATLAAGYADGLFRALSNRATLYHGETPCPLVGRVSMDLVTVDVTAADGTPETLDLLCPAQTIDDLARAAGTIGYEILTALGQRYSRNYMRGTRRAEEAA
ncbi:alanine racemase [Frigidibacter sp. SD6-1]|uniref:alanine racemase n=1 Tax=Frigidibacter sp. SD6-1 TaxID=3032581 RepID=UPI0024DFA444|nr:alanine racemase [Frigidibacter sp. SD6-1]